MAKFLQFVVDGASDVTMTPDRQCLCVVLPLRIDVNMMHEVVGCVPAMLAGIANSTLSSRVKPGRRDRLVEPGDGQRTHQEARCGFEIQRTQLKQGQLVLFASMDSPVLYATPRQVGSPDKCHFYHVMETPGHAMTPGGHWDLRGGEEDCIGHIDLSGKRVLEIGPESGYSCFFMESRGADVISVEHTRTLDGPSRSTPTFTVVSTGRPVSLPR